MFKKFHPVWLKIYLIKTVLYSPHVRSLGACYFLKMVSPRSMLTGNLKNIFTFFINCSNSPPGWSFEIDEEDVNKLLENENIQDARQEVEERTALEDVFRFVLIINSRSPDYIKFHSFTDLTAK